MIDGQHYTDSTSDDDRGRATEESEAELQAKMTAEEIAEGRLRRIDGDWRLIEDYEIERGVRLAAALATTSRDEWLDDGEPELATDEGTVWDFGGWNAVRNHLEGYGWVLLGGDLYALPKGGE